MSGWLNAAIPFENDVSECDCPAAGPSIIVIKPAFPSLGLFPSAAFHAVILSLCLYPPLFRLWNPPRIIEAPWNDLHREGKLILTKLTSTTNSSLDIVQVAMPTALKPISPISSDRNFDPSKTLNPPKNVRSAKPTISGLQAIVSIAEKPTNSIQTILRPDLTNPVKLKFPELLKPVVSVEPTLRPQDLMPISPVAETTSAHDSTNIPVQLSMAHSFSAAPPPNADAHVNPPAKPASENLVSSQAAIVLNAVIVPDDAPAVIPMAELQGSFVVSPVRADQSSSVAGGTNEQSGLAEGITSAVKPVSEPRLESTGAHSEVSIHGVPNAITPSPKTSEGSNASTSNPIRSTEVSTATQDARTNIRIQSAQGRSGITIIGGTSRARGKVSTSSTETASYGLTVISSGSTGGAGRDMGVFGRSETVYTIYIPMGDQGGPDWSLQYTILEATPSDGGMLTPPVAVRKVPAMLTGDSRARLSTIFLSGIISASGEITLKTPSQMDFNIRQAMDALSQWRFLPSKLRGVPVAVKVLIGVGLIWR